MREYHKIQTVFKRDTETKFKKIVEGDWSMPEFELLKNIEWIWTEKIDGTNIRIMWDGQIVHFGGKSENAQIPVFLLKELQDIFTTTKMEACFPNADNICLYGEGYGAKIQKGSNYIPDRTNFILFDCRIGNWWLTRESLENIAEKLNIEIVPVIGKGPLPEAVEYVKQGFTSSIAYNKDYIAEGLIMKPALELFNRKGERIITKIKYKDFHEK